MVASWADVTRSKPVVLSKTAPVAVWYAAKELGGRRMKTLFVSDDEVNEMNKVFQ